MGMTNSVLYKRSGAGILQRFKENVESPII